MMLELTFWISISILFYVYIGYYLLLKIMTVVSKNGKPHPQRIPEEDLPTVSIIITVYNEENVIAERIENLLRLDYPEEKIDIIIGSDGSTDRTVELAGKYRDSRIRIFNFKENRGRASVHNDVAKHCFGEILIFTDADSIFEADFIREVMKFFSEDDVGCVVGNLIYQTDKTAIAESEGMYWRYEKRIRQLESNLGIFATATGACTAVRKKLWKEIGQTDDIDFITPLDVIKQGCSVVFDQEATAYDKPVFSMAGEIGARIRQTSKNLSGTVRHWNLKNVFEHPLVSLGLFSHKILRWFTPYFLVCAFVLNLFVLSAKGIYVVIFLGQILFYVAGIIGLLADRAGRNLPIASEIFSFCVACLGMGIGVFRTLIGKVPRSWQSTN
jgi:poly-beta-1,6-N-acetyl-D-glucosamine synthase